MPEVRGAAPAERLSIETRDPEIAAPPRPVNPPPRSAPIDVATPDNRAPAVRGSLPEAPPANAPSPLLSQFDAAVASGNLIEPKNASAWDIYQRLAQDPSTAGDAPRLRPVLAEALTRAGRAIVAGDVRADNVADRVDAFRQAGQMFARARALRPDNAEAGLLEKLSAAEALVALQFYDEAERALAPLQGAKLAAVENALGLVHLGRLDYWQAERAFKRATETAPEWAAPHYNLALLYRARREGDPLPALERAAALDAANVSIQMALGDEYFVKEQWQKAADAYRQAVALKPDDEALHTKLGHALYSLGRRDEADREYQKANQLRGKRP